MHHPALLCQQRVVGDFLGERMLERVRHFRKGWPLVDELRSLEMREQPVQFLFGFLDDLLEQAPRELFANHRQGL